MVIGIVYRFFLNLLLPPWYSPGRPPLRPLFAKMKYVLVSGGVISGVGKGIIASSTGLLLKTAGLSVSSIKIDPYLNPDAGLMNVSLGPPRLPLFTVHVSLTNVFIASGV